MNFLFKEASIILTAVTAKESKKSRSYLSAERRIRMTEESRFLMMNRSTGVLPGAKKSWQGSKKWMRNVTKLRRSCTKTSKSAKEIADLETRKKKMKVT